MLRQAAREIRFHPGRFVATLVAIAISVGFMAGVSAFMTTMRDSLANGQNMPLINTDLIAQGVENPEELAKEIAQQAGVDATATSGQSMAALTKGRNTVFVTLRSKVDEAFMWTELRSGRWPQGPTELALSKQALDGLDAKVGDELTSMSSEAKLKIVGETTEPTLPTYAVGFSGAQDPFNVLIQATPGTDLESLKTRLDQLVKQKNPDWRVEIANDVRERNIKDLTSDFDVTKYLLQGFAAISMLVGMIIIANTFNILLAQRRRQIGLLRAVGASGSQVRRRFLAEAVLLGVLGSSLGIALGLAAAWVGAWWLGMTYWGLSIPIRDLAIVLVIGTIATVIAAFGPSVRATRVSPMEALQAVPTTEQARRITVVRYVVCGVALAAGVTLAVLSQVATSGFMIYGIAAGFALTVAVLGAAPIFVPWMVKGLGKLFSFAGPVVRLAAANGARNPQRAAATATALMLAMGLIVTLQVGISTMRTTMLAKIEQLYPVDVSITSAREQPISQAALEASRKLPGVTAAQPIKGFRSEDSGLILAPGEAMAKVAPETKQQPPPPGVAYVYANDLSPQREGTQLIFTGPNGSVSLKLQRSWFAFESTLVNPADLAKLTATPETMQVWYSIKDRGQALPVLNDFIALNKASGEELLLRGAAVEASMLERVFTVMIVAMSALMGVAVIIALVGVANTLGLSVLERQRESALLRALGMQRAGLRTMLLVEALLIAGVGAGVGIVAGAFFGWLGTSAALKEADTTGMVYSIDPLWTGLLLGVVVVAAAMASVLPGRRAALATPIEALAEE